LRWFSFILWGFDGFFGLWSISDAQCAGAPWTKKLLACLSPNGKKFFWILDAPVALKNLATGASLKIKK
jgi:hypothetical protein